MRLADGLAEGWYDHDWPEPQEIHFFQRQGVLRGGATVFDLGAHQGVVALILARTVGLTGRVVAVEAERGNASAAETNARLNDATNLTVIHAAVSDTSEPLLFAEELNGHVDTSTAIGNTLVPAITIDALAKAHGTPDLVYIDVEGYEAKALDGAQETLRNKHTAFFVEVHETLHEFGDSPEGIIDTLAGFRLYTAPDENSPHIAFDGTLPPGRFFVAAIPS